MSKEKVNTTTVEKKAPEVNTPEVGAKTDPRIAELEQALATEKQAHQTSNAKALEVIAELKKAGELKDALVEAGSKLSVKHGGKAYTVEINAFKLDGVAYNANDLKEKPELVAKLVKLGSSVLSEVTK